jgi:hypothetical protein
MSALLSTGTVHSPLWRTAASWAGGHSTRTSCPAAWRAQPNGTIQNQCPAQLDVVNSTRIRSGSPVALDFPSDRRQAESSSSARIPLSRSGVAAGGSAVVQSTSMAVAYCSTSSGLSR